MVQPMISWGESGAIYKLAGGRCNVFAVRTGQKILVTDTGVPGQRQRIYRQLALLSEETGAKAEAIFLTHGHMDHTGNAAFLQEVLRCPVFVHRSEAESVAKGFCPLPAGTLLPARMLMRLVSLTGTGNRMAAFEPVPGVIPVEDGWTPDGWGDDLRAVHLPGHTCGSMGLLAGGKAVLAGDALFGVVPGHVFPPYGDDVPALYRSWNRLMDTGAEVFFPSHGGVRNRMALEKGIRRHQG